MAIWWGRGVDDALVVSASEDEDPEHYGGRPRRHCYRTLVAGPVPSAPGRGKAGRACAVAALGSAVAAALWVAWRPVAVGPAQDTLEHDLESLDASAGSCERCPTGSCDRDNALECVWYGPPADTGAYHCKVTDCDLVPPPKLGISRCWHYHDLKYYSVAIKDAQCRSPSGADNGKQAASVDANGASVQENSTRSGANGSSAGAGEAAAGAAGAVGREDRPRDPVTSTTTSSTAPPTTTATATSTLTTTLPAAQVLFDFIASEVVAPPKRDVRLVAYWDVGHCGPGLDDQNSHWCGGLTREPKCKETVAVNRSVCESGVASLNFTSLSGGSARVDLSGCTFEYFADYVCLAPTSTTTTTRTTTTTSTKTTSLTTTWTETTTSTLKTTTVVREVQMLESMFELELPLALPGGGWRDEAKFPEACSTKWVLPAAPKLATDLNGVRLSDVCIRAMGPHYAYVIGDWGGMLSGEGPSPKGPPKPASQRADADFVHGVDDCAQQRVAAQMRERAKTRMPDYILTAGDHFYWDGLNMHCGTLANTVVPSEQFEKAFEEVYTGYGIDGKPWLGVLGNHDYGGHKFNHGWDQQIAYTWAKGSRWVMPAQYWVQQIHYPGFSVEYFFVDTNAFMALPVDADPEHNICSKEHNAEGATCGAEGPASVDACPKWFQYLWAQQQVWLEDLLGKSTADWQIIVTHFPPTFGIDYWKGICERHGVDAIIAGHVHSQAVHHLEASNPLRPTAWIVSGGGGGITSESPPDPEGRDDQYGFFELTLSKTVIQIQGISHGGFVRSVTFLDPRPPAAKSPGPGSPAEGGSPLDGIAG